MKALLGFAHKVGFTRFNAAPLIKLKKAPRQLAQRILSEVDVQLLIREARPGRNRLMFEVAYFGGLRVSELSSLTWVQVIPRETGEVQLALIGKGDKERHVLIPAEIAKGLLALRGDAPPSARVFPISERRINQLINPTGIVPKGPAIDLLAPTKRRATFRVPPNDARSLEGDREARRWQP